ncbi:hypothetical protein G7054_g10389 [Neopestalotiopsis clavispora]|nr:hypothetical protein G7054_g10389 [Neopestalotiopsis clavispora]
MQFPSRFRLRKEDASRWYARAQLIKPFLRLEWYTDRNKARPLSNRDCIPFWHRFLPFGWTCVVQWLQENPSIVPQFLSGLARNDSTVICTNTGGNSLVRGASQSQLSKADCDLSATSTFIDSDHSLGTRQFHQRQTLQPATPWLDIEAYYEVGTFTHLKEGSDTFTFLDPTPNGLRASCACSDEEESFGLNPKSNITPSTAAPIGFENVGGVEAASSTQTRGCLSERHEPQRTDDLGAISPTNTLPCSLSRRLTSANAADIAIDDLNCSTKTFRDQQPALSSNHEILTVLVSSEADMEAFDDSSSPLPQSADTFRDVNCNHADCTSSENDHGRHDGRAVSSQKRRRHDKDTDDRDDIFACDREGSGISDKRIKTSSSSKQRIACPYMKRYPAEFSTWRTCPGPGFDGMNRMKEHLKRRHFKELSCPRCDRQFKTRVLLHEHSTAPTACELNNDPQRLGFMTQLQRDDIHARRGNGMTDVERWKEIFKILFPEVVEDQIPSLYHDVMEPRKQLGHLINCDEYEAYSEQTLPQRIMTELNREFRVMAQEAKQKLVRIVQQQSTETLGAFMKEKGLVRHGEDDSSPNLDEGAITQQDDSLWGIIDDSAGLFGQMGLRNGYQWLDDLHGFSKE